jgi:hypothetical protein
MLLLLLRQLNMHHFCLYRNPGAKTAVMPCILFSFCIRITLTYGAMDTSLTHLDAITVKSLRMPNSAVVNPKIIEQSIGIADDLSAILLQKPGVSSVPEAGSLLLVNGEGPYDNRFLIRGIPVFPPAAFAGSIFADRSAVSLALPNDIRVYSANMSGAFSGASGAVVSIDPKILITPNVFPRAEAAIGFNTLTDDFSLNFPLRRYKDRYQFSFTIPNAFPLLEIYTQRSSNDLGYGVPASSWNFRSIGEQRFGAIKIEELAWLGNDTYGDDVMNAMLVQRGALIAKQKNDSWGIFALSTHDSIASIPWSASLGGARQTYREANIIENYIPQKKIQRSNVALHFNCIAASTATSSLSMGILSEYIRGKSEVAAPIKDSVAENVIYQRMSNTTNAQIHVGYKKQFDGISLEVNSNQGFCGSGASFFIDPGVTIGFSALGGSMVFSNELISSPPDIRGISGPGFENTLSHSLRSCLNMHWNVSSAIKIDAEPFFKWKYRVPLEHWSPLMPYWDESRKASLRVAGCNVKGEAHFNKRIGLTTKVSLSQSTVFEGKNRYRYDWDEPWSTSSTLVLNVLPDKLKLFCIGNFSAGLPYRDVISENQMPMWSASLSRLPNYRSVDLKCEWLQPVDGKLVTQYDGFIYIQNIFDFVNVRKYQWNHSEKNPVCLLPLTITLCARVNFRFLY